MALLIDGLIVLVYFAGIISLGLYMGRRENSLHDFALGGRKVPWWAVMASIIAAETSAATFLGAPGEGYENRSLAYVQLIIGLILGRVLVGYLFLKPYYHYKVYTVYDYLDIRFGPSRKNYVSGLFLFMRTLASAVRVRAHRRPVRHTRPQRHRLGPDRDPLQGPDADRHLDPRGLHLLLGAAAPGWRSGSRRNATYAAFREVGQVVRTVQLLRFFSDGALTPRVAAATNKVEAFNNFCQWLFFGKHGVIADNDPDEQEKTMKFNALLSNCVIFHTTLELTEVIRQLQAEGWSIDAADLAEISPYITEPIRRFGEYSTDELGLRPAAFDPNLDVDFDTLTDPAPEEQP